MFVLLLAKTDLTIKKRCGKWDIVKSSRAGNIEIALTFVVEIVLFNMQLFVMKV